MNHGKGLVRTQDLEDTRRGVLTIASLARLNIPPEWEGWCSIWKSHLRKWRSPPPAQSPSLELAFPCHTWVGPSGWCTGYQSPPNSRSASWSAVMAQNNRVWPPPVEWSFALKSLQMHCNVYRQSYNESEWEVIRSSEGSPFLLHWTLIHTSLYVPSLKQITITESN